MDILHNHQQRLKSEPLSAAAATASAPNMRITSTMYTLAPEESLSDTPEEPSIFLQKPPNMIWHQNKLP